MENTIPDRSRKRAFEILEMYIDQARKMEFIKSIILVGSLSDDTYTGNVGSDIDLVHIVSDTEDYAWEKEQIFSLICKIEKETESAIPIARVVYQEKHLNRPYDYNFTLSKENKDLMERPIEVFRILDSGITVYGEEMTGSIERPDRRDVEMSKKLNQELTETLKDTDWYRGYVKTIDRPSIRIMTQIVLTTALLEYYFYTGNSCSSKYRILECVERELPKLQYLNLLRLCHKNRFAPDQITPDDIELMEKEYQTCFKTRNKDW